MTRSQQRLLFQLATSDNELASGLGQCLEALRLVSALPRASPVFVKYTSAPSPTTKASLSSYSTTLAGTTRQRASKMDEDRPDMITT
ncbi:hypothetical protein EV363DRAFT_1081764, partial [Boletus edulis]